MAEILDLASCKTKSKFGYQRIELNEFGKRIADHWGVSGHAVRNTLSDWLFRAARREDGSFDMKLYERLAEGTERLLDRCVEGDTTCRRMASEIADENERIGYSMAVEIGKIIERLSAPEPAL